MKWKVLRAAGCWREREEMEKRRSLKQLGENVESGRCEGGKFELGGQKGGFIPGACLGGSCRLAVVTVLGLC
jgi:hypothetical protein